MLFGGALLGGAMVAGALVVDDVLVLTEPVLDAVLGVGVGTDDEELVDGAAVLVWTPSLAPVVATLAEWAAPVLGSTVV